ncbi:urotensin 1 [Myxocyprinus asiaticus]|uniref:urotensin 1 n=1 Tax=Myxocyprinus asiaticus TaxID=70543 RepID=UPI0022237C0A|nr:urotensin 1 [Myxocyprinus asiaticus]
MKPVSLVLLITSVLLTTHIPLSICRPRDLSILDGHGYSTNQLDDVLLNRAGDHAMSSDLVGEKILQYLQRNLGPQKAGVLHFTHFPAIKVRSPDEDNSLEELLEFSKRNDDPPISIDLTFHLLRNMIEMARIENQREQAGLNRKYLDEVGK